MVGGWVITSYCAWGSYVRIREAVKEQKIRTPCVRISTISRTVRNRQDGRLLTVARKLVWPASGSCVLRTGRVAAAVAGR